MDGKLFLYNNATPPPMSQVAATTFVFDLQRFTTAGLKTDSTTFYSPTEAAGYASSTEGAYFAVSNGKTGADAHTRYFNNIQAAINYIYTADKDNIGKIAENDDKASPETSKSPFYYKKNNTDTLESYNATITVLQDVTNGSPMVFGGLLNDSGTKLDVTSSNEKLTNLTIDLGGHTYNFTDAFSLVGSTPRTKAINSRNGSKLDSQFTIKNGTITTAEQTASGTSFQSIIKSFVNLTLEDLTIDATHLKGQEGGEDGAAIVTSFKNLTLKGKTSVVTQPDSGINRYYAVSGKLYNENHNSYASGFAINVSLASGYSIPRIGLQGFVDNDDKDKNAYDFYGLNKEADKSGVNLDKHTVHSNEHATNYSTNRMKVNVIQGEVGELTVDGVIVDGKGYTSYSETYNKYSYPEDAFDYENIATPASASNISLGNGAENSASLATLGLFDFKSGSNYLIYQKNGEKYPYTYAIEGWNRQNIGDDTELNYVAQSLGADGNADSQGKGDWLINVKKVSDKADLVLDTSHKIFGIPTSATAALKTNSDGTYKGYKLAYLKYNSGKDAVTITSSADSVNAKMYIAPKSAAAATDGILAESIKTIDASDISVAVSIIGNTLGNAIYDGKGDNVVSLGSGVDTLYFGGGADSIKEFASTDFIKLSRNIDPVTDAGKVASIGSDLILGFGSSDSINLTGGATAFTGDGKKFLTGVNVEASNGDNYVYTKQSIAYKAKNSSVYGSLTFTSVLASSVASYDASNESTFYTIDAGAVTHSMTLTGEGNNNRLIGSATKANTLYGKAGNDFLQGSTVEGDVFKYSDGNDTIEGFKATDKASVTSARLDGITEAKTHGDKLIFTVDKDNSLTFNNSATERISLETNGFLTQAGYVDNDNNANFRLFAGTKGNINLNDSLYSSATISAVDASAITNSVTLTADSVLGSLNLAANQKKDLFEYGGGKVTITGYENGKDRLDISEVGPLNLFEINNGDVAISVTSGDKNVISLRGAAGEEVLMRGGNNRRSNSFSKFVFHANGILYNKEKKPTEATIYSNIEGNFAPNDNSIKKIFVNEGVHNKSIQSGDNKATLDASAAGASLTADNQVGVSLVGGSKNNRFIGSDYADTFIYNGGKDMVNNFVATGTGTADSIALGSSFSIEGAKITLSKKSIKFKFDSKNTLTLKGDSAIESLTANGKNYFYAKNAYSIGGISQVSLTSQFSGTYKIAKDDAGKITAVDGSAVKKNLTFKGTTEDETFTGGQKKTTFKGGGGADSLVGGSGKDIFFYAKGDKDTSTIANFDFGIDKLKIANGTIQTITAGTNAITFEMSSGKKGDTSTVGSFKLTSYSDNGTLTDLTDTVTSKTAIKANNTYYWFAQNDVTGQDEDGNNTTLANKDSLITLDRKVTAREMTGFHIIDLGYSTNLAKSGVAVKVSASPVQNNKLPGTT